MRIRFGECVLDSETRELLRAGRLAHLSPKGLQFLELLLEGRPRALSKEEIHRRLWPETFVSDGTLTSLLAEVRAVIGDDARKPRFVRTVHRHGYAFSGLAEEERDRAPRPQALRFAFRLVWGLREILLQEGESILGRDPDATVLVDHKSVSRQHARIRIAGDEATLEDLGSKNGTSLRGQRLQSRASLADGDEIRVGSVAMTFRVFALSGSTESATEG
jgi:DNA-binding winged helix-turn-helix (wHTH) protein